MAKNDLPQAPAPEQNEEKPVSKRAEKKEALDVLSTQGLAAAIEQYPDRRDELEAAYNSQTT